MAIPVLFELNEEITRLFIAGSRLSTNDPRIKKYIQPLKIMGEKAPVFLKLAQQLEQLVSVNPEASAQKLIETETLILAILSTQGETATTKELSSLPSRNSPIGDTAKSYKMLNPVIEALQKSGNKRLEVIENGFNNGVFLDPRLIMHVVAALKDTNTTLVDFLIENVISNMEMEIFSHIKKDFEIKGKAADLKRLRAMHKIKGDEIADFAKECLENGNTPIKVLAIDILSNYKTNEGLIISLLDEKKDIKEAAVKGLLKLNSEKSKGLILSLFKNKNNDEIFKALQDFNQEFLSEELIEIVKGYYEILKSDETGDEKYINFFDYTKVLQNKPFANVARFFEYLISENYLEKVYKDLSNELKKKVEDFNYFAFKTLYNTTHGDNFIWNKFLEKNKIISGKTPTEKVKYQPKIFLTYAFIIGAKRLNPEEYFDTFFISNLIDEIDNFNATTFEWIFENRENRTKVSDRMAKYFITKKQFLRAALIVENNDLEMIKKLVEYFVDNMKNHKNVYENAELIRIVERNNLVVFNEIYEIMIAENQKSK